MKIDCLFLVVLAVLSSPISARSVHRDVKITDLEREPHHIQPRFLPWFPNLFNGQQKTESDQTEDNDDVENIVDKVRDAAMKAGSKFIMNAVTSALGDKGADTISKIKEGLESGDNMKVAEAVSNAVLSLMGPTGQAISNIGQAIQAGDQIKIAEAVNAALSLMGPTDDAISNIGQAIQDEDHKKIFESVNAALSAMGPTDNAISNIGQAFQEGEHKKVAEAIANAALSAMGPAGNAISNLGQAVQSGDNKKVADAIASAALSTMGPAGTAISNIGQAFQDGDHKKVVEAVANAALSAMGPTGDVISNIGQAMQSGDHKKVAGVLADAALDAALGSSGVALAKTGIGAAGHGLKMMGGFVGGALSKIGGDSFIGDLGDSIQDGSAIFGGHMTEYGGGPNATKQNPGELVGQVTDVALNTFLAGLGPIGGAIAKTGIGAAGKILQTGGSLVGNRLSDIGGDSPLGKLGDAIEDSSNAVGETMIKVGGTNNKFAGALGNHGLVAAGQALQKTGNFVGEALTKVAGENKSLAKLGQTIQSESQDVGDSMIDIGKGDTKVAGDNESTTKPDQTIQNETASNVTAAAA